jgi:hypothetical protein
MAVRYTSALSYALVLALLVGERPAAGQDRRQGMPIEFEGKYLAVMLKSNRDLTHTLQRVELRKLGDQLFMVGVGVDAGSAPKGYVGLQIWLALSDVSEIQVYPTPDALKKAFASPGNEGGTKKSVKP